MEVLVLSAMSSAGWRSWLVCALCPCLVGCLRGPLEAWEGGSETTDVGGEFGEIESSTSGRPTPPPPPPETTTTTTSPGTTTTVPTVTSASPEDTTFDPSPRLDLPTPTFDYELEIQPIWTARCAFTACHGTAVAPRLTAGSSRNALQGVSQTGLRYVEPFRPDQSYLWWKLNGLPGIQGAAMPLVGSLTQDELDTIEAWILDGAEPK